MSIIGFDPASPSDYYLPDVIYNEGFAKLVTAYNTIIDLLESSTLFLINAILTEDVYWTLPSGLKILLFKYIPAEGETASHFELQTEAISLPTATEVTKTIFKTKYHANVYPGQSFWQVFFAAYNPVEDVVLIPENTDNLIIPSGGYKLSSLATDISLCVLLPALLAYLSSIGFSYIKDVLLHAKMDAVATQTSKIQILDDAVDAAAYNVDDILTRVKKLYAGSYV